VDAIPESDMVSRFTSDVEFVWSIPLTLSFTRAAEKMHTMQPALSQ
jgi:DNA-binding transcriptional LysR family regulator